ncbi:hypothetical protein AB0N23_37190, partial [Streptomyces sp. NPDC052644]
MTTNEHAAFKQEVDELLRQMVQQFYREVEGADHLFRARDINMAYYQRHVIEIILRLRMKRWIDALTIHYFTKHNPVLAKKWCAYTEDEMLHDSMFAKDLERVGAPAASSAACSLVMTTSTPDRPVLGSTSTGCRGR